MDKLYHYDIPFVGLKEGVHTFTFDINQTFFTLFEAELEFTNADLRTEVKLHKHSTFLECGVKTQGKVDLVCDVSARPFSFPVATDIDVLVKFGEEYDDSDEEVVVIPHTSAVFNVAQLIYESVMLSIPMKKLAPDLTPEELALVERFQEVAEEPQEETLDPRWEALKKLKDKN